MNKKWLSLERVMTFCAFIFLAASFAVCLWVYNLGPDPKKVDSFLPYASIIITVVHGLCAIGALVCFFVQSIQLVLIIIFIESEITIFSGMETMGIFLFYGFMIVGMIKNVFEHQASIKALIFYLIHISTIIVLLFFEPIKGLGALFTTIFFFVFFVWVYEILRERIVSFLPENVSNNSVLQRTQLGTVIYLCDYNLTERQMNMIYDCIVNNLSYKELSDKYYVSISTVKKEFALVFHHFSVNKIEELKYLLSQYKVEKERPENSGVIFGLTAKKKGKE